MLHLKRKLNFDFIMPTLNTILKELKNVPVDRLEDLYSIINSLRSTSKKSVKKRKKILSFAGSFSDVSEVDYNEFLEHTRQTRTNLFEREISI